MKKVLAAVFLTLLIAGCDSKPKTATEIYNESKDGVVMITDVLADNKGAGLGTGFILGDNMIVTNDHVVSELGTLSVYSSRSKRKYDAEIVYTDKIADLAVIRLKDWEKFVQNERPTILSLGDSEKNVTGNNVYVMGHPWGLAWSISQGIVSSKSRRVDPNPKFVDQLDAHLFNGNSGGPIFNNHGEVICVSELMIAKEGGSYGFCIPSNLVKKVLYDFNNFKEIRWRAINVSVGLSDDGSAAILKSIDPTGAAAKAGLQVSDKITKIYTKKHPDGVVITNPDDLISEFAILDGDDDHVRLAIERNGKSLTLDVKTNYKLSKEY